METSNFYEKHDSIDGPPPPNFIALEVNVKGCINAVHVGRHYIDLSPEKGSIVVNASCSSFWPTYFVPVYTASKFGILGFMRCVAHYYKQDGIRINALCPGAVRTSLIPDRAWDQAPADIFTPPELISEVVLKLAEGVEIVNCNGNKATSDELYGKAIVDNGKNIHIQPEPAYCDDIMERTMENSRRGEM